MVQLIRKEEYVVLCGGIDRELSTVYMRRMGDRNFFVYKSDPKYKFTKMIIIADKDIVKVKGRKVRARKSLGENLRILGGYADRLIEEKIR